MKDSKPSIRCRKVPPAWHADFEAMIPTIETHAKISFRHLDAEAREEAVQETICNACQAYARLFELKKTAVAYPGVFQARGDKMAEIFGRSRLRPFQWARYFAELGHDMVVIDRTGFPQEPITNLPPVSRGANHFGRAAPLELCNQRLKGSADQRCNAGVRHRVAAQVEQPGG